MLSEHHTPVWALLTECEQLAQQCFDVPTRIRVEIVPSLDGDFWNAAVCPMWQVPGLGAELAAPCRARGKVAALKALREQLSDLSQSEAH